MFGNCYKDLDLNLDRKQSFTIEATLQLVFRSRNENYKIFNYLHENESVVQEMGGIWISSDSEIYEEEHLPEFEGVCFEYDDHFVTMSLEQAEIILQKSMDVLDLKSYYPKNYEKFKKEGILIKI